MNIFEKARWAAGWSVGLLLAAAPVARAQQSVELIMDNFTSSVVSQTNTLLANNAVEASMRNARRGTTNTSSTAARSLAYQPTAAARQQAVTTQARSAQPTNPTAQQQFVAAFGPGGTVDYGPYYRRLIQGSGLRENDVTDAFAAYLVGTYRVSRNEAPGGALLPAAAVQGVRAQFSPMVARALSGKPAGTVAALGEYLKLQTVLLAVGAQQSTPQFRQNVAAALRQRFKLDVAALALTSQGFTRK